MNCPVCDNKGTVRLGERHKEFELYHCPVCDLIFWHPMKGPGTNWYQTWTVDFAGIRPIRSPHNAYKKFFRGMPAPGGKLLDIGCGTADFCYLASRAGYSVTGIDLAPHFIEVARQRFPSLDLESLTLEEFVTKRPDDKYDVVTFIQLLEHLDSVRDFVQLARAVLKPSGYIVCAVPNRERWRFFSRLLREKWDYPPNHFTWWNGDCLTWLFDSFGFSILSMEIDPITPFDCSFLLTEKLHFHRVAEWLGRKLIGGAPKWNMSSHSPEMKGVNVAKVGYRFYYQALLPFFGLITLPLLPLLRKSGSSIYLLAQLRD